MGGGAAGMWMYNQSKSRIMGGYLSSLIMVGKIFFNRVIGSYLVPLEVRLVLNNLDEGHLYSLQRDKSENN